MAKIKVIKSKKKKPQKPKKNHGKSIYLDTSSKGDPSNSNKRHNTFRADITINGHRYRKRDKDREKLEKWVAALLKAESGN
jgi:hypothetical protein